MSLLGRVVSSECKGALSQCWNMAPGFFLPFMEALPARCFFVINHLILFVIKQS